MVTINGRGLVKCPKNTAPYTLTSILKLFPSSLSLKPVLVRVSATLSVTAISLFLCPLLAAQILGLGITMPSWIKISKQGERGGGSLQ